VTSREDRDRVSPQPVGDQLGDRSDELVTWLLEPADPAVRAATLQRLLGRPPDDAEVVEARQAATATDPIAGILAAMHPDGWWVKPGPGYAPKYTGTVWELIFLDQLGADPADQRVQRACDYVLRWCPTSSGGLGFSGEGKEAPPPPSRVVHCLNGNLLRALIGFGRLDHPATQAAIDWAANAVTGADGVRWYASGTPAPHFACGANDRLPCAWGATKELRALARVPKARRTPTVTAAIEDGVALLLSRDPAVADYPMGYGNTKPNGSWFKLGFPSGYVTDVLQVLEVLTELGHGDDPRLDGAKGWLADQRGPDGRWRNRYAYPGKTIVEIEPQGAPSKWVTLRALTVLRASEAFPLAGPR
jgi:hypothetical protein